MTSGPGSWEHAAKVATGQLARLGWSRLASLVGGAIAGYGESCWRTDPALAKEIRRPDGRGYHPESIARVRRKLRDAQVIECERVLPNGELPTKAKYRFSTRGTTIKKFNWGAIQQKNPFNRRSRRQRRMEQAEKLRDLGEVLNVAPRQVSTPAIMTAVASPSPPRPPRQTPPSQFKEEIERLAAEAQEAQARRAAAVRAMQSTRAIQPDPVAADPAPI